jgi:hypothetical protein
MDFLPDGFDRKMPANRGFGIDYAQKREDLL